MNLRFFCLGPCVPEPSEAASTFFPGNLGHCREFLTGTYLLFWAIGFFFWEWPFAR